ncbi:DNA double-strand break repair protein Mre11 [Halorubellus sp. PRR65]|uniref:DNA double-strand break repair protein Mre11 n=1 Tax=Halorubellus sp. PRR65 TaxID=3098148 RepID=UPI002B25D35F|nr:DNA double-strand break repair protein Mre11 [Halorubellus sp. PRR65]
MTRVIHTGDTHVGYRQYHSPERQRDFLAAFEGVVADAVDGDVDAVVHAGDLFHDRRPGLRDLQGTVAALRDLRDADIPFLAVVGNHEGKRDGQWLDLFEDLGLAERLDATPRVVGDTAFYGLDFVPRSRREDLDYDFESTDATHAALVSHGLFEPFAHADWDTERLLDESTVSFDAVLLGDNHTPGTERLQDAWVTYCGSTERASASERDDRGYNIVTFDADEKGDAADATGEGVAISRRGLDTREFVFVDVDLEPGEGAERVREAVRQYDATDAVVVVTIRGDGEPVTPAPVEELALDDGALVVRVNDRRDVTVDTETSVSFADPDEAVRERVRDLGLSEAARGIDETVREGAVADSNVRDTVEARVRDIVEDADMDAFASADDASDGDDVDHREDDTAADDGDDDTAPDRESAASEEPATVDAAAVDGGDGEDQSSMGEFL